MQKKRKTKKILVHQVGKQTKKEQEGQKESEARTCIVPHEKRNFGTYVALACDPSGWPMNLCV